MFSTVKECTRSIVQELVTNELDFRVSLPNEIIRDGDLNVDKGLSELHRAGLVFYDAVDGTGRGGTVHLLSEAARDQLKSEYNL